MNYYEHHLGDYARDTSHLSLLEHGVYRVLLDWYYANETGIPEDKAYRYAHARTDEERAAVDSVLSEFFELERTCTEPVRSTHTVQNRTGDVEASSETCGVWINRRAEEEIARYRKGNTERGERAKNEKERLRRYREERAKLFAELRLLGITPKWNMPFVELKERLQREQGRVCTEPVRSTHAVQWPYKTSTYDVCTAPATAPQTPVTSSLLPFSESSVYGSRLPPYPPKTAENATFSKDENPETAARKDRLCRKLRGMGIDAGIRLAAWAEILPNFSDAEIESAAEKALERKNGTRLHLNYLLPILRDRSPPKKNAEAPWWSSEKLALEKGRALGLEPRPGEEWGSFKGRIQEKLAEEAK
jgi:uncharacterized protein YdaU (DUF1376 family)